MKRNPDVVWMQAEVIAKALVSCVQILNEKNESTDEVERYENNLKKITGECSKVQFMDILADAEKYIPKNDKVVIAAKYAVSLPTNDAEDEFDFSYFMTLVHFHIASKM